MAPVCKITLRVCADSIVRDSKLDIWLIAPLPFPRQPVLERQGLGVIERRRAWHVQAVRRRGLAGQHWVLQLRCFRVRSPTSCLGRIVRVFSSSRPAANPGGDRFLGT
jgi:hypothetical protein